MDNAGCVEAESDGELNGHQGTANGCVGRYLSLDGPEVSEKAGAERALVGSGRRAGSDDRVMRER